MTDAAKPSEYTAEVEAPDDDVDVADVSGGAVPEQMLEDDEGEGPNGR